MKKNYIIIASLFMLSNVALAQESELSCTINCPENISQTLAAEETTKIIHYSIGFDCENLSTDCNIAYQIDSIEAQINGNHAINTNWAGYQWIVANDFDVPSGQTLKFTTFIPTLSNYAMEGDVYFYADNNGKPGTLIASFQDIAMSNMNVLGNTSLGAPIYEATYELPEAVELTAGKYWVGLHAEMLNPPSVYHSVYWATSGEGNIAEDGYRAYRSLDNGASWNSSMQNSDGAFKLKYECSEPKLVMTEGLDSGEAFPLGTTTVKYELVFNEEVLDECTFTVTIDPSLGIENVDMSKLLLYPNPVNDYLHIESANQISEIAIYSIEGKLIKKYAIHNTSARIDLMAFASGVYIVKEISENVNKSYKIIKK